MDIKKRFGIKRTSTVNRLITALTNSKVATQNNALYQTIFGLIKNASDLEDDTNAFITQVKDATAPGGGGSGGLAFPVAVEAPITGDGTLVDPLGVAVDGTTIIINGSGELEAVSTAPAYFLVPMSTGAEPLEIMSDGAGNVFLVAYTP